MYLKIFQGWEGGEVLDGDPKRAGLEIRRKLRGKK